MQDTTCLYTYTIKAVKKMYGKENSYDGNEENDYDP